MQLYIVGGAVRDALQGKDLHEIDYAIEDLTSEYQKNSTCFSPLLTQIDQRVPVFRHTITNEEFALCRRDTKTNSGHHGFIYTTAGVNIKEDLLRRDLSINAIACPIPCNLSEFANWRQQHTLDDIANYIRQQDQQGNTIYVSMEAFTDLNCKFLNFANAENFYDDPIRIARFARFYSYMVDHTIAPVLYTRSWKVPKIGDYLSLHLCGNHKLQQELYKTLTNNPYSSFLGLLRFGDALQEIHVARNYPRIKQLQDYVYGDSFGINDLIFRLDCCFFPELKKLKLASLDTQTLAHLRYLKQLPYRVTPLASQTSSLFIIAFYVGRFKGYQDLLTEDQFSSTGFTPREQNLKNLGGDIVHSANQHSKIKVLDVEVDNLSYLVSQRALVVNNKSHNHDLFDLKQSLRIAKEFNEFTHFINQQRATSPNSPQTLHQVPAMLEVFADDDSYNQAFNFAMVPSFHAIDTIWSQLNAKEIRNLQFLTTTLNLGFAFHLCCSIKFLLTQKSSTKEDFDNTQTEHLTTEQLQQYLDNCTNNFLERIDVRFLKDILFNHPAKKFYNSVGTLPYGRNIFNLLLNLFYNYKWADILFDWKYAEYTFQNLANLFKLFHQPEIKSLFLEGNQYQEKAEHLTVFRKIVKDFLLQ